MNKKSKISNNIKTAIKRQNIDELISLNRYIEDQATKIAIAENVIMHGTGEQAVRLAHQNNKEQIKLVKAHVIKLKSPHLIYLIATLQNTMVVNQNDLARAMLSTNNLYYMNKFLENISNFDKAILSVHLKDFIAANKEREQRLGQLKFGLCPHLKDNINSKNK